MSNWPFRFVHAADFHLERPPFGVAEVPDHLHELFIEAAYWAAERVFQTVTSHEADFLVLSGDILSPQATGPRGPLFLVEQFQRLAERGIAVYWAGGRVDPPEQWPSAIQLPQNVHRFPTGRPEDFVHLRDATPLVRLIGASRGNARAIRASDFDPDPAGLFSIGVVHCGAKAELLKARGINYWALGGCHNRHTLSTAPYVAHYPGSPQGRQPGESGPHGCTLVEVDGQGDVRTTAVSTDVMRWQNERIHLDEASTRDDLDRLIHQRMQALVETLPGMDLLISWTIAGRGPLLSQLRQGRPSVGHEHDPPRDGGVCADAIPPASGWAAQLLATLREEYGFGPPAAWSTSLSAEAPTVLPSEWYEQQTICGDFLRQIRHYQMNPEEPIELESYLSEQQLAGSLGSAAAISSTASRERVLREAAVLGVDLLSGEEPHR